MAYSKYGAERTVVDGITFDSKKEARRYGELRLLERAGVIRELKLQPRFPIAINGHHVCEYRADFQYEEAGITVTEDVKGAKTPSYLIKKKLMLAVHGIHIKET